MTLPTTRDLQNISRVLRLVYPFMWVADDKRAAKELADYIDANTAEYAEALPIINKIIPLFDDFRAKPMGQRTINELTNFFDRAYPLYEQLTDVLRKHGDLPK